MPSKEEQTVNLYNTIVSVDPRVESVYRMSMYGMVTKCSLWF